jgi:hypothetical protein
VRQTGVIACKAQGEISTSTGARFEPRGEGFQRGLRADVTLRGQPCSRGGRTGRKSRRYPCAIRNGGCSISGRSCRYRRGGRISFGQPCIGISLGMPMGDPFAWMQVRGLGTRRSSGAERTPERLSDLRLGFLFSEFESGGCLEVPKRDY